MKILIVSRLRTRSTFLLEHLCAHYNIQNHNENYFDIGSKFFGAMNASLKLNNRKSFEKNWLDYQLNFKYITDKNFETDFGVKLFTKMIHSKSLVLKDVDFPNLQIITDLTTYANIRQYDQIYYLSRENFPSICSYIYSLEIKNAIYRENGIHKIKQKTFTVDEYWLPFIDSYILDIILQEKILDFLSTEDIPYIKLDYDDIPSYVSNNLNGVVANPSIDPQFDYKVLIKNYDELENYCNQTYEKIYDKFSHVKFT
jgi:hypothetical protein